jgi:arsenate reductase
MAEAFLRAYAGDRFEVYSAGVDAKGFILPEVVAVMKEIEIGLDGQWSKSVTEYLGKTHFAHVITVCGDAEKNCPTIFLNMGTHEHWSFEDPAAFDNSERLDRTREVRDQIAARIQKWLETQTN